MGGQYTPPDHLPPTQPGFLLQAAQLFSILLASRPLDEMLECSVGRLGTGFPFDLSAQESTKIVPQSIGQRLARVGFNYNGQSFRGNVVSIRSQPVDHLQVLRATFLENDIDGATYFSLRLFWRLDRGLGRGPQTLLS